LATLFCFALRSFDFDRLGEVVRVAIPFLDRVIDINYYPTDAAAQSNAAWRPVGLGLMGLQDVFFKMRVAFDSPEARALSREISEHIYFHALWASTELAEQFGPHPTFADTRAAGGKVQFDLAGAATGTAGVPVLRSYTYALPASFAPVSSRITPITTRVPEIATDQPNESPEAGLGLLLTARLAALRARPAIARTLVAGLVRAALAGCRGIGTGGGQNGGCGGRFVPHRADLRRITIAAQHRGERVAILLQTLRRGCAVGGRSMGSVGRVGCRVSRGRGRNLPEA